MERDIPRLHIAHPLRSLRALTSTPAWRGDRGRKTPLFASLGLALILGTAWVLVSKPAYAFDPEDIRPELVSSEVFDISLIFYFGRFIAGMLLPLAAIILGAGAFATERQSGTMQQLLLLPISRLEILAVRLASRITYLLPSIAVITAVDLIILPRCLLNVPSEDSILALVIVYGNLIGATVLSFALAAYASLRVRSTTLRFAVSAGALAPLVTIIVGAPLIEADPVPLLILLILLQPVAALAIMLWTWLRFESIAKA
jgi:ABC-type transport system involved in multi-copper enzyme maturation permease subunit